MRDCFGLCCELGHLKDPDRAQSCHSSNMNPLCPSYNDSGNINAFSCKLTVKNQ